MTILPFIQKRAPGETTNGRSCRHGHGTLRYVKSGGCVECTRLRNAKRRESTPKEKLAADLQAWIIKNRDYANRRRVAWSHQNPARVLLVSSRRTAKSLGLPFNLTIDDIVIPECCPIFGMPLEKGRLKRNWNSPSIDRIIPELGYIKGNIIIISWRANRIKADASLSELEILTEFYRNLIKSKG